MKIVRWRWGLCLKAKPNDGELTTNATFEWVSLRFYWSLRVAILVYVWIHCTHVYVLQAAFLFLFFFFFTRFGVMRLLLIYCSLNSNHKCWLFYSKQCISILFMNPQIPLFSNFFIKNGSHDTIHTFKNYFATMFSVFSFSKISSIQTDP